MFFFTKTFCLLLVYHHFRVKNRMSPKSSLELLETIEAGNHFIFTVVRHPFDRLISAYRDRILKGCTDQAKYHIPGIFSLTRKHILTLGTRQLFDKTTNCIKVFPTFQEFIQYVVEKYKNPDPHWTSYHQVSKRLRFIIESSRLCIRIY